MPPPPPAPAQPSPSQRALLEEGFCLLALLRGGAWPTDAPAFRSRLEALLARFRARAVQDGKGDQAVQAEYAFCALADELLLAQGSPLREAWARAPLQLTLFGDHLAGEGFFRRLDALRQAPLERLEALEVYQACLLLGFQGRYLLEEPAALRALTAQVGQELDRARGGPSAFAPHAEPEVRFASPRRHPVPFWSFATLLVLVAATVWSSLSYLLWCQTREATRDRAPGALAPRGW